MVGECQPTSSQNLPRQCVSSRMPSVAASGSLPPSAPPSQVIGGLCVIPTAMIMRLHTPIHPAAHCVCLGTDPRVSHAAACLPPCAVRGRHQAGHARSRGRLLSSLFPALLLPTSDKHCHPQWKCLHLTWSQPTCKEDGDRRKAGKRESSGGVGEQCGLLMRKGCDVAFPFR